MTSGVRRIFKDLHCLRVLIQQQRLVPQGNAYGYARALQQLLDAVAMPRLCNVLSRCDVESLPKRVI